MDKLLIFVVATLTGQFDWTSALPTITCNTNMTITLSVLSTDTDYLNKTIRLVDGTCVGTAGPVSSSGGDYVIPVCSGTSTINWDTDYQFLFQRSSNYWTSTDTLLTLRCALIAGDKFVNVSLGVSTPTTDATITDTVTPTLTLDIKRSGLSVSTAVVGDSLSLSLSLDSTYTNDFTIIIKQITLISGSNTLSILDNVTYCVNSDGTNIGFSNPSDSSGGSRTSIDITFSAFMLTLDSAAAVSQSGNSVTFSVQVGVCFTGSSTCDPQNCTGEGTSNGRRRREITDIYFSNKDLSKPLMIFVSEQAQSDFLSSIVNQVGNESERNGNDVCVDKTTFVSVVSVLVILISLGLVTVFLMLFRSRWQNTGKKGTSLQK